MPIATYSLGEYLRILLAENKALGDTSSASLLVGLDVFQP